MRSGSSRHGPFAERLGHGAGRRRRRLWRRQRGPADRQDSRPPLCDLRRPLDQRRDVHPDPVAGPMTGRRRPPASGRLGLDPVGHGLPMSIGGARPCGEFPGLARNPRSA